MKKILFLTIALMMFGIANARVIRISYSNGTEQVYTSSELSSIVFNNNGTLTIYSYDGTVIPQPAGVLYERITVDDQETVTSIVGRQLNADINGVTLTQRQATAINFVYSSVDPENNTISLSGTILVPNKILNGSVESEGIILTHHYSVMSKDQVPTHGVYDASIYYMLCNPLNINYIVVVSDFYGFGVTERFPQAYLVVDANARASLVALLAARRILRRMGINYGNLTFNVGTSSGGFDAMQTLRAMQIHPGYESIYFDKTFAYGGPYDIDAVFRKYIEWDTIYYSVASPLVLVSFNECANMGLSYESVFKPFVANHIQDWFQDKNYTSEQVLSFIGRGRPLSEMLQPSYCDVNNMLTRALLNTLKDHSVNAFGRTPDTTQRIFLMHSHGDVFVRFVAARNMLDYLTSYGYQKSIIPGRTNLQTNVVLQNTGHVEAGVNFMIQTLAAIKAWPMMYSEGILNPYYDSLAYTELDVVATMRQLDAMGFDCRGLITEVLQLISGDTTSGEIDFYSLLMQLNEAGIDMGLLLEVLDDSGIDGIHFLLDLVIYHTENNESKGGDRQVKAIVDRMLDIDNAPNVFPTQRYAKQLRDYFGL